VVSSTHTFGREHVPACFVGDRLGMGFHGRARPKGDTKLQREGDLDVDWVHINFHS